MMRVFKVTLYEFENAAQSSRRSCCLAFYVYDISAASVWGRLGQERVKPYVCIRIAIAATIDGALH